MAIQHWEKHLIDSIDTDGFQSGKYYTDSKDKNDLLKFAYNRFMSEKGWQVEREGMKKALNEWLSGLALNVAFYNHEILKLGKDWGEISENATEAREDYFLYHWFNNLTATMILLWKKQGII